MASPEKEIVFIIPKVPDNASKNMVSVQYPINIGSLAAQAFKYGFKVTLKDYLVEKFDKREFSKMIGKTKKLFCLSCFSSNIKTGHELAKEITRISKNSLVVVGGSHPSNYPEETLNEFRSFDAVMVGEADISLVKLAESFFSNESLSSVEGLVYREEERIIRNKPANKIFDLDRLPFSLRDLKDLTLYRKSHVSKGFSRKHQNISEMITSRGCAYNCIFCVSSLSDGARHRSAKNVNAEIDYLHKKYKVNHISFEDDILTLDKMKSKKVSSHLGNLGITWNCNSHVNHVDKSLLIHMIDSGCQKISFGVESGSQRILNLIKKGSTTKRIRNVFKWCHYLNLKYIEATVLIGAHPDETLEDIELTKKLIDDIKPHFVVVGISSPYPGTAFTKLIEKRGLIPKGVNWDSFVNFGSVPNWKTSNFSTEEMLDLQKSLIKHFYFSPKNFLGKLGLLTSFDDLLYFSTAGLRLLKNYLFQKN